MAHEVIWHTANKKFTYRGIIFVKDAEGRYAANYKGDKLTEEQLKALEEVTFSNDQEAGKFVIELLATTT